MKKPRKRTDFRENTGKVLIDLGKLVFGSMFLGGVCKTQYCGEKYHRLQ